MAIKIRDVERRFISRELRVAKRDDGAPIIPGYAAVFDKLSEDLGGWQEIIRPGAFSAVIGGDVRALVNHISEMVLGRTAAGTLALEEDDIGLRYEILPPDTQYARDLMTSIERGDVSQSSFSFSTDDSDPEYVVWHPGTKDSLPLREVLRMAALYDVSPVTFPAYPTTSVGVRDMAKQLAGQATGENIEPSRQAARRLLARRRLLELKDRD